MPDDARLRPADQPSSLPAADLRRGCDLTGMGFETTDELDGHDGIVGQDRAARALEFGVSIRRDGYHVFALGPEAAYKRGITEHYLTRRARDEPAPEDLCYVHGFEDGHSPEALKLPAGRGRALAQEMNRFLEGLPGALRAAFESEEYQVRRQGVAEQTGEEEEQSFEALQQKARERGLALLRTPAGFLFAPIKNGEVLGPEDVETLEEDERDRLQNIAQELQGELQQILRRMPRRRRELQEQLRALDREIAELTVRDQLEELRERYGDLPEVRQFLDRVQADVVEHASEILSVGGQGGPDPVHNRGRLGQPVGPQTEEPDGEEMESPPTPGSRGGFGGILDRPELRRYRVNLLVDHGESDHAPVIHEEHPTYQNLLGRIEYAPVMGALVTDYNLIRPGALHRANGGYLVLDVHRVLTEPLAWEGLKRALEQKELRIESAHQAFGFVSTVTIEPEPVPLDVKVVLLGSRLLYYLLSELDPDFPRLFKVAADFDDRMDRSAEDEEVYAQLVAELGRREELLPFHRTGVERVLEWSARMVGDGEKLSARTGEVLDLMREADHWCRQEGGPVVEGRHVDRAVDEWVQRASRVRDHLQEEIRRGTLLIDTEGRSTGQLNGLAVLEMGGFAFGRPNRISARVRVGRGEVVNIEREVELSGPIHSKGVLILSSFLGARYAAERPLSLAASLVFEQSYGEVDGDSASAAELFALLSAIGQVPLRQAVAVTGSVNQHGQVQAIGGVNEKIEGFFDVCRDRGLTGDQGVMIPRTNARHLMLRPEVVEAVEAGDFHVWPVDHVDQGMEILTGVAMGERQEDGTYPEGTVNRRVEDRLTDFARAYQEFSHAHDEEEGDGGDDGNGDDALPPESGAEGEEG